MARDPNAPQPPHPGRPDPETTSDVIAHLFNLQEAVEAECAVQPDQVKAALLLVSSGIGTLKHAVRTTNHLER